MDNDKIKDLEVIRAVFEQYGVNFYVVYGAALGYYRDGKLLPGDDDIDLAVVEQVPFEIKKKIGWALYDLGFMPQNILFNVFGRMEPSEIGYNGDEDTGIIVCERNFKFTIFFFKREECEMHGDEYVCIPKLGALKLIATPQRFYKKAEQIKIGKKKYNVPSPMKEYLSFTYFNNWKDKNDRRHGDTYFAMHNQGASIDITGQNEVTILK